MSRSYRKSPYCRYICVKEPTVRKTKRMANRQYRHKLNAGLFDNQPVGLTDYKIVEDIAWTYDLKKYYIHISEWDKDYYEKFMRRK